MAEGHAVHGMAARARQLCGQLLRSSAPEGVERFDPTPADRQTLAGAQAHGKHLLIDITGVDRAVHLHFGMSGKFSVRRHRRVLLDGFPRTEPALPAAVRWRLLTSEFVLDVVAPTVCEWLDPEAVDALHARLGPDPLRDDGDPEAFVRSVRRSRRPIGVLLVDQSVIAGVGNVYRAEMLHRARLNPFVPGRDVSAAQLEGLWQDAVRLLTIGLGAGWIVTDEQQIAAALPYLLRDEAVPRWPKVYSVYGREGLPCRVCATPVRARPLGLQRMFWCPTCQADGPASLLTAPV